LLKKILFTFIEIDIMKLHILCTEDFLNVYEINISFLEWESLHFFYAVYFSTRNRNFRNKYVYSRSLLCRIHVQESVAAGALFNARDEQCNTLHVVTCTSRALPSRYDKSSYLGCSFRSSRWDILYMRAQLFIIIIYYYYTYITCTI